MIDFIQAVVQHVKGEVTQEAESRAKICAVCPLKEMRSYARIFEAKMEDINGYVCNECGCPLATKIFAKEPDNICPKWIQ